MVRRHRQTEGLAPRAMSPDIGVSTIIRAWIVAESRIRHAALDIPKQSEQSWFTCRRRHLATEVDKTPQNTVPTERQLAD